jgi:hypothetical protein
MISKVPRNERPNYGLHTKVRFPKTEQAINNVEYTKRNSTHIQQTIFQDVEFELQYISSVNESLIAGP